MILPTVLIVPGLRDHVAQHWQTLLESRLRTQGRAVASVPPMGRDDLDCAARVAAIASSMSNWKSPETLHSRSCVQLLFDVKGTTRYLSLFGKHVSVLESQEITGLAPRSRA